MLAPSLQCAPTRRNYSSEDEKLQDLVSSNDVMMSRISSETDGIIMSDRNSWFDCQHWRHL